MRFYENGFVFDTNKSRLLYDSGFKNNYDMDGYLGESRERLFVSQNNLFYIIINSKYAKFTFMNLFFGAKTNKFRKESTFCKQVDLHEACSIMNNSGTNSRIKFENEFLKCA